MPVESNESKSSGSRLPISALEVAKLGQRPVMRELPATGRNLAEVMTRLLDKLFVEFQDMPDSAVPAMLELQSELATVKETCTPEVWSEVIALCHAHPISRF